MHCSRFTQRTDLAFFFLYYDRDELATCDCVLRHSDILEGRQRNLAQCVDVSHNWQRRVSDLDESGPGLWSLFTAHSVKSLFFSSWTCGAEATWWGEISIWSSAHAKKCAVSRDGDQWAARAWCPAERRGQADGPSAERLARDRGSSGACVKMQGDHLSVGSSSALSCVVTGQRTSPVFGLPGFFRISLWPFVTFYLIRYD